MAVEQRALDDEVIGCAESWVGRWKAHDVEGIIALVSEGVAWEDPSIDGTAIGTTAARAYTENLLAGLPRHLVVDAAESQLLKICQPWACRGTMLGRLDPPGFAPTGRAFDLEGVDLWELDLEQRRLRRVVSWFDGPEFARRTGLMPARGSGEERWLLRLQRCRAAISRRRG